jgi:hypothetical protein
MQFNHKTYKTYKTMNKSKEKRVAARNRVAAGKRASWPLSPQPKYGFESFAGFVTKIEIK